MTRRPPGPLLPRNAERSGGLGALAQGRVPLAFAAGTGLLVLVLVVLFLASRCGGATQDPDCSRKSPAPPSGFAFASRYCVSSKNVGQTVKLTIPLTVDRTALRGLSIYTYDGGSWARLSAAQVSEDGASAVNTSAIKLPKSYVVLRRSGGDFQVLGELPAGAFASADAGRNLTAAVPQTFVPGPDGNLSGGPVALTPGASYGVIPSITAQGGTEAQSVNAILAEDGRRNAHIDRIVAEAEKGSYEGVEIDYSAVDTGLKNNFTAFAQALASKLHGNRKRLVLRMPLPRRDGSNWSVGAYDWTELGKVADALVMGVERDQAIYRMRVPEAVKYVTSQVDPRKLLLEITPLSEERSDLGTIRSLTTAEALSIAGQVTVRDRDKVVTDGDVVVSADNINREGGSGPQWLAQGVVTFSYRTNEDQRTVWIENSFSVGYKLEIVQLYHLGGIAVDNASADPRITNIWPAIEQYLAAGAPLLQQPNPQSLRPQWLSDGKPLPDVGNRAVITWRAPSEPGRHTLAVIVGDGTMRVTNTTDVDVRAGIPGGTGPSGSPQAGSTPGARFTPTPTRAPATVPRATTPQR